MSKLIYIDTNVWISLFKEEKDKLRPISDFSFELFRRALNCEYDILISPWVLKELRLKNYEKEALGLINDFKCKNKCYFVKISSNDYLNAKQFKHWQDRLHEILANKGNADYLVTRNVKDFEGDLLEIKFPENL